jgi:hypothetical protein
MNMQVTLIAILLLLGGVARSQQPSDVPVVNGELGSCWVQFQVSDHSKRPVYNSKIRVLVRHGFLSKRKLELEVGTNAEGKARVAGLPSEAKNPLVFEISLGKKKTTVKHDPAPNCHANYDVVLPR